MMTAPKGKKGTAIMLHQHCSDLEIVLDDELRRSTTGHYQFYFQTEGRRTHGLVIIKGKDNVELHHTPVGWDFSKKSDYLVHATNRTGMSLAAAVAYLKNIVDTEDEKIREMTAFLEKKKTLK